MQDFWSDNAPFPIQTEQHWRELVEQTVDRASFDRKLVHTDLDGNHRQPVYPQAPVDALPGQFPYTRGSRRNLANRHGWQIAQSYDTADASALNQQLIHELEGGVASIELRLATGGHGAGLQCNDIATLDTALTGVQLELIHIALYPDADNTAQAALLLALCNKREIDTSTLQLSLNIDPLGQLARHGQITLADSWQNTIAKTAQYIAGHCHNATVLCADGSPYHNSGASAAQQIACAIATGIEYLRVLCGAGIDPAIAARQIEFNLSLDSELFESVAMHRAIRKLWATVLHHSGISQANADMSLRSRSGVRSLTQRDNSVNMLRITTQCLAAALGGATSFNSASYDQLCGESAKGRRIARNTQLILMEESGIHHVLDPMGGSGHIEALTDQLAESAWAMIQSIDAAGGMCAALLNNTVQDAIANTRELRIKSIAVGKTPVTGVSEFPQLEDPDSRSDGNPLIATDASPVYTATLAEIIETYSNGDTPAQAATQVSLETTALQSFRDAAVFESMRDRSDSHTLANGRAPTAALITLGEQSDYGPRVNFSQNFLAVAGIHANVCTLAQWIALKEKPALAVLCGSDSSYRKLGVQACADIAANSDATLWLAGKLAALELDNPPANIAQDIHLGCDRVGRLNQALSALEVA